MSTSGSSLDHIQLTDLLRQAIVTARSGEKHTIYETLEKIPEIINKINKAKRADGFSIDPNLPVDLICVAEKDSLFYYTLFLVVSTKKVPDLLASRIIFYKFYLSRIISSRRLEVVLVAPDYAQRPKDSFFQDNGIGLWMYETTSKRFKEVFPPASLHVLMDGEFQKSKPKDIPWFFDRYVHDAVRAIAGVSPSQFGKRYIDRKVINRVFDLENISYRDELQALVNDHLTGKDDEYEFASEVFHKLWKKCIGIPYTDFLSVFDPVLQHVFAEPMKGGGIYRDHYLHQFQVFLLGLCIMDKLYDHFATKYEKPEVSWLIIASFHDVAYPVQLYDTWSDKFFNQVFDVPEDIAHLDLKSRFVEQSFMKCTNCLIARLCSIFSKEELKDDWLSEKNSLVHFFYRKITEAKNHCLLSSISLLKMAEDSKYIGGIKIDGMDADKALKEVFVPSALAIALHDDEIWQGLKDEREWQKVDEKAPLSVLKFEDDPLSFLLIFCDNVQEWGRPVRKQEEPGRKKVFYLKDIQFGSDRGFDIIIWTPNHVKTRRFFKKKKGELEKLQQFLQQNVAPSFAIHLEDKKQERESFQISGSL